MRMHKRHETITAIACLAGGLMLAGSVGTASAGTVIRSSVKVVNSKKLELISGKSVVIESSVPIGRVSIANPEVADALVLSPRQVYVSANTIGSTNLTLWRADNGEAVYSIFDINVTADVRGLKEQLHKLFPDDPGIEVIAANDNIALSGIISSASRMSRALAIAEAYAPEKVVNLMRVGGLQQVMLEVRVAEMSRDLLRNIGVNLAYTGAGGTDFGVTTLNDLSAVVPLRDATFAPNYDLGTAPFLHPFGLVPVSASAIFRMQKGGADWTGFVDALKQNGLVKILAEPNLVSLSGQEATFLAGGEFPFPVPRNFSSTTIEFKKFGVGLSFKPTVLSENLISIDVSPEVSELDFTNALVIAGFTIPAITVRRASTVVELRDGQSFAIAGLIRESLREKVSKFPVLGEVPVLGTLFRSSEFQKNESELIIIVTPRLVKPMDSTDEIVLPTDVPTDTSDLDFYLMGKMYEPEATRMQKVRGVPASGMDGDFGHVRP